MEEVNDEDVQDEGFDEDSAEDITVPVLSEDDLHHASPQASAPHPATLPADLPSSSGDGGQHPATAPSVLPDTSESDVAQVRHFKGGFNPNSMSLYFSYITINQLIY